VIRVVFPELTEERRKEFVRLARERAEEGRISVRNVRRATKNEIGKLAADSEITEDDERRADKSLQEITDKYVHEIDNLLTHKEKDLLEV
jgi:ribosome recycling factor